MAEDKTELDQAAASEETQEIEIEIEDTPSEEPSTTEDQEAASAEPSEDHKTKFGQRAQKRIRELVSRSKQLEERLEAAEKEREELQSQNQQLSQRTSEYEENTVSETEQRLLSDVEAAKKAYRDARQSEDLDAETEAMEQVAQARANLMAVQARKRLLDQQKAQAEQAKPNAPPEGKPTRQEAVEDDGDEVPVPEPDERTQQWVAKNTWISAARDPEAADPEDLEMAQLAARTHEYAVRVLLLHPVEDADEYWSTIDNELKKQFPHRFEAQEGAEEELEEEEQRGTTQRVSAPRAPARRAGRKKVKATQQEVAFANKYGIPVERLVRERLRLEG